MTPEMARERREQMLRDGYCVIPDILSPEFLLELRQESDRLNDTMEHHPDTKNLSVNNLTLCLICLSIGTMFNHIAWRRYGKSEVMGSIRFILAKS